MTQLEKKIDLVISKLEKIERALNITKPSLWENLLPLYNVNAKL